MSNPLIPNYKKGVGRLATDRFDFQDHIDGYNFRHNASSLSLSPLVTINGVDYEDVQEAITKLAEVVSPPDIIVNDATVFAKGIVQLAGDIGGTATNVKVIKLQGFSVSTQSPTTNQVLTWNGIAWSPATPVATFIASNDLFGTNTAQTVVGIQGRLVANLSPNNGNGLIWSSFSNRWEPAPVTPTGTGFMTTTSDILDGIATPTIRYESGKFQTDSNIQFNNLGTTGDLAWSPNGTNKTLNLPDATDTLVGQATFDTLTNKTINATDNEITDYATESGDILVSDGIKFVRQPMGTDGSFLGVFAGVLGYYMPSGSTPSGTGFATVTTGAYDATATTNIRYESGKFQTDNGIQFNNTGVTGDLLWTPASSNKTILLPNASDTLVGQATADTLTNKTINVASNTLTVTSQAGGDLLVNNGTQFVRLPKGTALQVLRVNAGATGLEWAASSSGSSSGTAGTLQVADGSGGFSATANVSAGTGFVAFGTTPSGSGALRFPYAATDVLVGAKDLGGTDREVISRISANQYQIGPTSTSAYSIQHTGANIDFKPGTQFRVQAPSGTQPSLTVSGTGQVKISPNSFDGLTVDLNGAGNGANANFFAGPAAGSGEQGIISIGNSSAIPAGTPTGGGYLYAESGALKYKGTSGTVTTVAPADPHCKKCGRDFMHEWTNETYGSLSTCVPCLLDALEALGINVNAFSDRNLNS